MVDQLDLQILEVIENAPSIVRSVTEREIESGVLSPSVTTIDIKRNLPSGVSMSIIEGRLKALEDDGYIFYEKNRWWLTRKGRESLGKTVSKPSSMPTPSSKPMRTILEETFSKFEAGMWIPTKAQNTLEDVEEIRNRITQAEALLSELKRSHEIGLISEEEFKELNERVGRRLNALEIQTDTYLQKRHDDLLREIDGLESQLAKKKIELEKLDKILSEKSKSNT